MKERLFRLFVQLNLALVLRHIGHLKWNEEITPLPGQQKPRREKTWLVAIFPAERPLNCIIYLSLATMYLIVRNLKESVAHEH